MMNDNLEKEDHNLTTKSFLTLLVSSDFKKIYATSNSMKKILGGENEAKEIERNLHSIKLTPASF